MALPAGRASCLTYEAPVALNPACLLSERRCIGDFIGEDRNVCRRRCLSQVLKPQRGDMFIADDRAHPPSPSGATCVSFAPAERYVYRRAIVQPRAPDEVSENNRVILYFPLDPVGAVFNRTGHRLKITQLIN